MNTTRICCRPNAGVLNGGALLLLLFACKDDDPCDPGWVETQANSCFPEMAGSAGMGGAPNEETADSGAPGDEEDFEIGQPCADTAGSSDCGGTAPICAPLPSGAVCTQVMCLDGEPNAGVCPDDWPCTEIPGYPSTCLNL
jgi:hypothetical protein